MKSNNYSMRGFAFALALAFACIILAGSAAAQPTPPPEKRTVYLIANQTVGFANFPLQAYTIVGNQVYLADTWRSTGHGNGPVGLALDEINENLFVSSESSQIIEVFDATDATPLGSIRLTGTSNLAGMVVNQDRDELYVVDRGEIQVFVFDTTTFALKSSWWLPSGIGAWGIDLLDNWLFVADTSNTIRWYDIDTHTEVGNFTQTQAAVGITVTDYPELIVFTGSWDANTNLIEYHVDSETEEQITVGQGIKGVSLNPALTQVYVTTGQYFHTVDYSTNTILHTETPGWSSPTDVLSSGLTFAGTVRKTCTSHPNGKIYKGDAVTFEIHIQNRHALPLHTMDLQDIYDNTQLFFVSADLAADDNTDDGQLDWTNLIAQHGADLLTGEWIDIEVNYTAIEDCEAEELLGVNTASISNVTDSDGFALSDASGQFEYSISCFCRTNLDCDDGLFCNGAETCNVDGECVRPGNPCPLDDNLYCNGNETSECDEDLDECGHENPPCEDDGLYCNGQELCNEDNDTCTNAGNPCADDSQFCNGDESCDEDNDLCLHSGDPCNPGEECNEAEDSCFDGNPGDDDTPDEDDGGDEDLWPKGKVTGGCCGC